MRKGGDFVKRKNAIFFIISAILIVLVAYTMVFGLTFGDYMVQPVKNALTYGLDLKGGVYIEEEAVGKVSDDDLNRTKEMLALRVNSLGVSEPVVALMPGTSRIRIEIPGVYDAKAALDQIGRTGNLRFVGPNNDTVITGQDVKDATVGVDPNTNKPVVQLKLNASGAQKFSDATAKYINQTISIYMDNDKVSSPTVESQIPNGEAIITGSSDINEAKRLAGIIKSGALPVKMSAATVQTIGPSLGAEAIPSSKKAAMIGLTCVLLFMLLYYRVPGFIADLALTVYIILTILVFIALKATLTLPGIAGLLLSIGMAVDANVLIFERIKEELALGKSLKTAIDLGFHRAWSSIIDSNVTTLIAGFSLYFLGSGTIKGFALTLNIGVLCSMFTAITVTRFLLKTFVNAGFIKNINMYKPVVR
jgi:preprotein translocase subunit SecD